MNENESYSIKDLIDLVLSHIVLIILVTIFGGAAALAVSKLVLPLEYSSHITMYVQSYTGISENVNAQNNISNSKQLVNTYMEVLKDDAVMNAVGDLLLQQRGEEYIRQNLTLNAEGRIPPSAIRDCLSVSTVTDTSAVKIVATALRPELAADICNDLTRIAPKYVEQAVGVGSINTIDQAKVYDTPVGPNTKKNVAIGMAGAFALMLMIIFLIDFFDNTIKSSDELANTYKKPIIGEIQQFGDGKKKKRVSTRDARGLLTEANVPFNVVESYKSIRTNLLFTIATQEKKVVSVTSANPSEGKSTSAANIAIALAQTGSKVLLIDADMRKPVQHQTFKTTNSEGLSTLIIGKTSVIDSVQRDVIDNLDLIPSGPIPPNPSELLASDNFKRLIDKFSEEYEYVIIDTPPINMVSDAMVMKDSISGLLLVIRYAVTTDEELANCMKQIELAQTNVLGFVLNDVHIKRNTSNHYYRKYGYSKGGYGYGYGYGYGSEPELTLEDEKEAKRNSKKEDKKEEPQKDDSDKKNIKKKGKGNKNAG